MGSYEIEDFLSLPISVEKFHGYFDWDFIESINWPRENSHFHNINSINQWAWDIFPPSSVSVAGEDNDAGGESPTVYCSEGSGTWESGAEKWGGLKSQEIANCIQNSRQFILRGLKGITWGKSLITRPSHETDELHVVDKSHMAKTFFFCSSI